MLNLCNAAWLAKVRLALLTSWFYQLSLNILTELSDL